MIIDIRWNKWFPIGTDGMLMIKHYHVQLGQSFFSIVYSQCAIVFHVSYDRKFYARQDEIIDHYSNIHERHTSGGVAAHDARVERHKRWTLILIKTTLISNIVSEEFGVFRRVFLVIHFHRFWC